MKMQLGISSLSYLLDFSLTKKITDFSEILFSATEACLNYAEKNNLKLVELVIEPQIILDSQFSQKFMDLIRAYSINKQVHGPFIDLSLCSHNPVIAKVSLEAYVDTYKLCKKINVSLMTIHPGKAHIYGTPMREYNKMQLVKIIYGLLDSMKDSNFTVCLENMPKSLNIMLDHIDIQDIFGTINRNDLYLTYDTSHYYTNDGDVGKLWELYHTAIKNVHLVDNFSKNSDTHPKLGSGLVNFKEIFEIMEEYNYKLAAVIELASSGDLDHSIEFVNRLL